MSELTALELDTQWLIDNHYEHLNADTFSDWVTRNCEDGQSVSYARTIVAEAMDKDNDA